MEGDLSVSGTVFKWTNDAGWTFDIMRGAGLSRTPDMDPGSRPGYFYLDWWFQHSGEVISGSSNSGVNPVCLKRAGIQGYPSNCYWYYYDRLACVEATGDDLGDPQICGWYGEVKEAGLEQEAGFPEPPGG